MNRQPRGERPAATSITCVTPSSRDRALEQRVDRAVAGEQVALERRAAEQRRLAVIGGRSDSNITRPSIVSSSGCESPLRAHT